MLKTIKFCNDLEYKFSTFNFPNIKKIMHQSIETPISPTVLGPRSGIAGQIVAQGGGVVDNY